MAAYERIRMAQQRLVLCRLLLDTMRSLHGTYAPANEPFGNRLETFFVGLCVALGELDGKPFSTTKIAAYMRVPRSTATRRLSRLEGWGLIHKRGRYYCVDDKALNSLMGMRSYQRIRGFLSKATEELAQLDARSDRTTGDSDLLVA
jgi:hypothetical protein